MTCSIELNHELLKYQYFWTNYKPFVYIWYSWNWLLNYGWLIYSQNLIFQNYFKTKLFCNETSGTQFMPMCMLITYNLLDSILFPMQSNQALIVLNVSRPWINRFANVGYISIWTFDLVSSAQHSHFMIMTKLVTLVWEEEGEINSRFLIDSIS